MRRILGLALLFSISSCGRVNDGNSGQLADNSVTGSRIDSIDWYFPCPFDGPNDPDRLVVPTQTSPRKIILNGPGPFEYAQDILAHVPVRVHGRVCPWKLVHRDVVFVIDVSGSMIENDPMVEALPVGSGRRTCGRLDALNAILAKMPANITSFGVVTYDEYLVKRSSRIFRSKTELFDDLTGTGSSAAKIENIICSQGGGTVYKAGLDGAKAILETGEQNATKEIIFLSDGEPQDSGEANSMATDLKTRGINVGGRQQPVNIATVFLGQTAPIPNVLEQMASVDSTAVPPKPVYAVATNAADLADQLGRMIDNNKLQGAQILQGGDGANSTRTTVDVFQSLDAKNQFVTAPFQLAIDRSQTNYILNFEYWDTMQNRSSYPGTLHWQ